MTRPARKRTVTPDAVLRAMEDKPGPLPDAAAAAWDDAIVEGLIRGEAAAERLATIATQVATTHRLVEAIASVLMACAHEAAADSEGKPLPDFVNAAFARLESAMAGDAA
jgi:hypothetical protein